MNPPRSEEIALPLSLQRFTLQIAAHGYFEALVSVGYSDRRAYAAVADRYLLSRSQAREWVITARGFLSFVA